MDTIIDRSISIRENATKEKCEKIPELLGFKLKYNYDYNVDIYGADDEYDAREMLGQGDIDFNDGTLNKSSYFYEYNSGDGNTLECSTIEKVHQAIVEMLTDVLIKYVGSDGSIDVMESALLVRKLHMANQWYKFAKQGCYNIDQ